MANFPTNSFRFIPDGMIVDDGPINHVIRAYMALPAEPPAYHGEYAIAVADREVADLERPALLTTLVNLMRYNHNVDIQNVRSSPFGIGLFRFGSVLTRDTMVEGHGFQVDEATRIPQPPPGSLVNLNSIPAAQGVNAEDGSVLANNVYDDLESVGFGADDPEEAHLDLDGIAQPAADNTDDEYVLVNVQHAIRLSDALAAAIADVQINSTPTPVRILIHPIWGPIQDTYENPLAIVPFQPQGMPPSAPHASQLPLVPSDPQFDVPETSAAAASRKRPRQTPTRVALLRRSPRSNKYQGFKQQLNTDKQTRKSHVKPSPMINMEPLPRSESNVLPVNTPTNDEPRADHDDQVPPPTPVQVLQQVAFNLCGVPEEEVTQELLQAPPEDKDEEAHADEEEDAAT
ncbi:hypothetical protein ACQ4PT_050385 [Festuca glaucescens]